MFKNYEYNYLVNRGKWIEIRIIRRIDRGARILGSSLFPISMKSKRFDGETFPRRVIKYAIRRRQG